MSSALEVIDVGNAHDMDELARAMYHNEEPAFQIDGVGNYHDLKIVFEALRSAAPKEVPRRSLFSLGSTNLDLPPEHTTPLPAHVDRTLHGLAVHQNISSTFPVVMATALKWTKELYMGGLSIGEARERGLIRNIKSGMTMPGRLTVFSQGNGNQRRETFPGLLPTFHFFDRSKTNEPGYATRYETIGRVAIRFLPKGMLTAGGSELIAAQTFRALQA